MCSYSKNVSCSATKGCIGSLCIEINSQKDNQNHSKITSTLPELEHSSLGAQATLCTTEPSGLEDINYEMQQYIQHFYRDLHIQTDTYAYLQIPAYSCIYIHIHAHAYT
jgi:hypothetical protein